VASYGKTVEEAYLKALKSTGFKVPKKAVLFGIQESYQPEILETARLLKKRGLDVIKSFMH
jgi:carbamoyl-phosphate synthase (ammonia)